MVNISVRIFVSNLKDIYMNNLNHIAKILFGLEWSELDEDQKKTCVIYETCNQY